MHEVTPYLEKKFEELARLLPQVQMLDPKGEPVYGSKIIRKFIQDGKRMCEFEKIPMYINQKKQLVKQYMAGGEEGVKKYVEELNESLQKANQLRNHYGLKGL
jgi:septation ring formation regulator EzrA